MSEYRGQTPNYGRQTAERRPGPYFSFFVRSLVSVFCLLSFVSCAPKYAEKPSHGGIPLDTMLSELRKISSVEAVLYVEYAKNEHTMSGDAFLNLSEDALNMRLYYLGFLAGEVHEEGGIVRSKPKLDKNKSIVLIDGLKNSFLWWNIKDYVVQEKDGAYLLKSYNRKVVINKETLLPVAQTIQLENGEELSIEYDSPVKGKQEAGESVQNPAPLWYQSHLTIRFKNYLVNVSVKSYSVSKQKI